MWMYLRPNSSSSPNSARLKIGVYTAYGIPMRADTAMHIPLNGSLPNAVSLVSATPSPKIMFPMMHIATRRRSAGVHCSFRFIRSSPFRFLKSDVLYHTDTRFAMDFADIFKFFSNSVTAREICDMIYIDCRFARILTKRMNSKYA